MSGIQLCIGIAPAFEEAAGGVILMNGIGADIWGTSDAFRFAYKSLTGNGSLVARVESIHNSNTWAKAGVMIRQSVAVGSTHAFMAKTPGGGNGASFQRRLTGSGSSTNNDITAAVGFPYWVKIQRAGNSFTAYTSPVGTAWTQLGAAQTIAMSDLVLIGLAVCSHEATIMTGAEFSNVSTTGTVSGSWQVAEIGLAQSAGNSAEPVYVTVTDSAGTAAPLMNPDPLASGRPSWQQWKIPLSDLTAAGMKATAVKSLTVGVGNRTAPVKGGAGTLYIDDIAFGNPDQ